MFLPTREPLLLSEAGLLGFHASLNTPIVNIADLPVGPSRAAIVLHTGEYGTLALSIGLHAVQTGQVVLFRYQGPLDDDASPTQCMNEAIKFAEQMGFIFDDDMVASGGSEGRARALRSWQELLGEPEVEGAAPVEGYPPDLTLGPLEPLGDETIDGALLESSFEDGEPELLLEVDEGFDRRLAGTPEDERNPVLIEDATLSPDPAGEAVVELPSEGEAVWFDDGESEPEPEPIALQAPAPAQLVEPVAADLLELDGDDAAADLLGVEWEDDPAPPAQTLEFGADRLAETALAATPVPRRPAPEPRVDASRDSVSGGISLTKFRTAAEEQEAAERPAASEMTSGSSELGRIPIVRMRRRTDGTTGPPRPSALSRLLGSF